jgi:hypothetical protein
VQSSYIYSLPFSPSEAEDIFILTSASDRRTALTTTTITMHTLQNVIAAVTVITIDINMGLGA